MNVEEFSHQLPSPLAQPSWEPRFAIDAWRNSVELIQLGLRCSLANKPSFHTYDQQCFTGYVVTSARLAVACRRDGERGPDSVNSIALFERISLEAAATQIQRWLDGEAEYPNRPWFDGGESRGFQMFDVPWARGYDLYHQWMGYTLVEPKWIEVHK